MSEYRDVIGISYEYDSGHYFSWVIDEKVIHNKASRKQLVDKVDYELVKKERDELLWKLGVAVAALDKYDTSLDVVLNTDVIPDDAHRAVLLKETAKIDISFEAKQALALIEKGKPE